MDQQTAQLTSSPLLSMPTRRRRIGVVVPKGSMMIGNGGLASFPLDRKSPAVTAEHGKLHADPGHDAVSCQEQTVRA